MRVLDMSHLCRIIWQMSTTIWGFEFREKPVTILPNSSARSNPLHMPGSLSTLHSLCPTVLTVGFQHDTTMVKWSACKVKEYLGVCFAKLVAGLSRFESEFYTCNLSLPCPLLTHNALLKHFSEKGSCMILQAFGKACSKLMLGYRPP